MRHYIFGYGSLINRESRLATGKTGETIPVRVSGLQRAWNVIAHEMGMAGIGVIPQESGICNGVLIEVEETEIAAFDRREIDGTNFNYDRVEIEAQNILGPSREVDRGSKVWAYVVRKPTTPSLDFPIVQSYVDVILTGCLEFGKEFAIELIQNTGGWEYPWYNDRRQPRYIRHLKEVEFQVEIDHLLARFAPIGFTNRKDIETTA